MCGDFFLFYKIAPVAEAENYLNVQNENKAT